MGSGIIAKIKHIKDGSMNRSGVKNMSTSLAYIMNKEKCDMKLSNITEGQVVREVNYVLNDIKTVEGLYIGCRQISDIKFAVEEMMQVKEFYGKTGGRVALHLIISLNEEESGIENAGNLMNLADDLMNELLPENQAVYAVHTNTDNLHIHVLVNTVGLDGRKIHMDNDYLTLKLHPAVNKLARRYGFTPNIEWERELEAEKLSIVERKIKLRNLIDHAIENSTDLDMCVHYLRESGCVVNIGQYMSLRTAEMSKAMRSYNLGNNYTLDAIKERISNRLEPFELAEVKNHVSTITGRDVVSYTPNVIKKYKDMTEKEKREAIHMLKLGRNPWLTKIHGNFAMRQASEEMARLSLVHEIVTTYSTTNNPEAAKREIVERKKELGTEIKSVKKLLSKYKPQIAIYKEMQLITKKAYLYEFADLKEYQLEYERYQELEKRLEDGYGKTIAEVAEYAEDLNNQLIYAQAQVKELSNQYKAILSFQGRGNEVERNDEINLFTAIGHSEAKNEAFLYNLLKTRQVYLTSKDNKECYIRVLTLPAVINGRNSVSTTVTVMSKEGVEIEEFSSEEMTAKEFNQRIKDIRRDYGVRSCIVNDNENAAKNELNKESKKKVR
ncbi:relaxase/mobilization nuclease domain-containing protein [Eubacterium oxidoreducens]|uniref:Relaxase/Mobilisation nuclease domain-containing protein n=1 Tax=Eubacterium oxidoreducens TaxID=1732 RepID=A0A1G6A0Q2_EUBOX|nr:relaxase/mobilization nuclease domain-containing protein [Eubacterium oxidoreducens]SDB01985.1 Relaxase/Mobilisation nuclease domain-containing protein [Eubacterium oxidoreducens]